jgi:hypothetical protein
MNICHLWLFVGFEVLTAVSTKMAVFWVVDPDYQTTWCYNPEDSHLHLWFSLCYHQGHIQ